MPKDRKIYVCQNCGNTSTKWEGRCHVCGEWDTYEEEIIHRTAASPKNRGLSSDSVEVKKLSEVERRTVERMNTQDEEFDRVLGGGFVPGSLVLLAGEPGIGKSTLVLQSALQMGGDILYISGEESEEQIRMRADRFDLPDSDVYILSETMVETILEKARQTKPRLLIVDSIQTLTSGDLDSTAGTISQIRECTGMLQTFAKKTHTPVMIIGHITKEGRIAGPKLLEHVVDVVLQFEGDRHHTYRLLRTVKNRFGSTDELGIYEMLGTGLRPVENPSELLMGEHEESFSGSAIAATMEGRRPLMIETQALVSTAVYGTPQRTATGFDLRRLGMLLAVLEKRCGFQLGMQDVFINMAGGVRTSDPAIDLAVVAALMSSHEDEAIDSSICFAGEVGLSGEIRAVSRIDQRITEADRLGFKQIFISRFNMKGLDTTGYDIHVTPIGKVLALHEALFT